MPRQIISFIKVLRQTDEQARHAFASYPGVHAFGVVIALGDCWIYREYYRKDPRRSLSPTASERIYPSFTMDSDSDKDIPDPESMSKKYTVVEEIIGHSGFACLQTTISDKALVAVQKRLCQENVP